MRATWRGMTPPSEPSGRAGPAERPGSSPPARPAASGPFGPAALAHAGALYNLARRLTRNDADAQELVQEAYARALAGAHTFTGGSLKAWLFKILRNTFVDTHHRGRPLPIPIRGDLDGLDAAGEADRLRDDSELDGLRRVVAHEIEDALALLSDEARAIILLDVEGFTETEVA